MGTNFYLCVPIEEAKQRSLHSEEMCLQEDAVNAALPLHVCKRSWNWKPLFQSQRGLYATTAELVNVLESNSTWYLQDEYGTRLALADFRKLLESWKGLDNEPRDGQEWPDLCADADGFEFTSQDFW